MPHRAQGGYKHTSGDAPQHIPYCKPASFPRKLEGWGTSDGQGTWRPILALVLALRTSSYQPVHELSSQNQLPCHELPGVREFILEKSKFGGLIHCSFSCSTLIFLGVTCRRNTSSLGIQVNPWTRGCFTSCIPALGLFIQGRDCWSQEDMTEGLLLAVSSVNCWGLDLTTNGGPAEGRRPVKIPLLGCKTSTET